jgi:formamidopyrimidine-DNA glycosylase
MNITYQSHLNKEDKSNEDTNTSEDKSSNETGGESKNKYLNIKNREKFLSELPLEIRSITARGKKVIFHLNNESGEKFWLIFSLGLTGIFQKEKGEHSDIALNIVKRGKLKIDETYNDIYIDDSIVYFDDKIKYGNIYFCFNKEEKYKVFKDTGFDLTRYALTRDNDRQVLRMYWKALSERRRGNMLISNYLLNQKFFAGPGNYIKSEALNLASIHPGRKLATISREESDLLCLALLDTLKESYEKGGAHLKDFYRFNGEQPQFKCKIYQSERIPKKERRENEGQLSKTDDFGNKIKWVVYKDKRICFYTDSQK